MSSRFFKAALAKARESKSLDTVLVGSSYLPAGIHDVTIKTVDTSKANDEQDPLLQVTFVAEDGREHNERVRLMSRDGTEFNYGLRSLWSALIPGKEELDRLFSFLEQDEADYGAFEMFTGMRLRFRLEQGNGFIVKALDNGQFAAFDVQSNEQVSDVFPDLKDASDDAKAKGHYRSYLRTKRMEATHADANKSSFNAAADARAKAQAGNGGPGKSGSGGGKGYAPAV